MIHANEFYQHFTILEPVGPCVKLFTGGHFLDHVWRSVPVNLQQWHHLFKAWLDGCDGHLSDWFYLTPWLIHIALLVISRVHLSTPGTIQLSIIFTKSSCVCSRFTCADSQHPGYPMYQRLLIWHFVPVFLHTSVLSDGIQCKNKKRLQALVPQSCSPVVTIGKIPSFHPINQPTPWPGYIVSALPFRMMIMMIWWAEFLTKQLFCKCHAPSSEKK